MTKTDKAVKIIKLLKKGMTPKEIRDRIGVSYNYAWKLQKDLKEAAEAIKTTVLSVDTSVYPNLKPGEFVEADTNVDAILNERASTYGSFESVAGVAQEFKALIHTALTDSYKVLEADQVEALDMIASKLGRIICGDSNHVDSWVDIAGYAQLVADRLQGKVR